MQEIENSKSIETHQETIDLSLCTNCKSKSIEEGFPTKLCADCREYFIKYPIPKWIWLFSTIILLIMAVGVFRMPKYISAAYHLSKAEKAVDKKAYLTAQRELLLVLEKFPDNLDANANLLIASAHNHNYVLSNVAYQNIAEKEIKDNDLFKNIQNSMELLNADFPADTALYRRIKINKDSTENMMRIYDHLAYKNNIDQYIAGVYIADMLYDRKLYDEADKLLSKVLLTNQNYYPALGLLIGVKRNLKQYDEAIEICNRILAENSEDVSVIAQKSRTELKRSNDTKAAEYAAEAMNLNPDDIYAMESQALVDYYANRKTEYKKLITKIKIAEQGGDPIISNRIEQIILGKVTYR